MPQRPPVFARLWRQSRPGSAACATVIDAAAILQRDARPTSRSGSIGDGVDEHELRDRARPSANILNFRGRVSARNMIAGFAERRRAVAALGRRSAVRHHHPVENPILSRNGPADRRGGERRGRRALFVSRGRRSSFPLPDPAGACQGDHRHGRYVDRTAANAMGRAGIEFYRKHFSFSQAIGRTLALLEGTYPTLTMGAAGMQPVNRQASLSRPRSTPPSCASCRWSAPRGLTRLPLVARVRLCHRDIRPIPALADQLADLLFADWVRLIGYVALCLDRPRARGVLGVPRFSPRHRAAAQFVDLLLPAGAIAAALLLVPSSLVLHRAGPWEMLEDAARPRRSLSPASAAAGATTEGSEYRHRLLRALVAPLMLCDPSAWGSFAGAGSVDRPDDPSASSSFWRPHFLDHARHGQGNRRPVRGRHSPQHSSRSGAVGRWAHGLPERLARFWPQALIAIVFLYLAQGLSPSARASASAAMKAATPVCANDSSICADLDNPWISWLPLPPAISD